MRAATTPLISFTLAVLFAGAASTAGASAAEKPVLLKSFGSFENAQSLAVDQATGDVYVLDVDTATVERFTASGEPAPFAAPGSPSYIAGNELTGTTEGGFLFDTSPSENEIAVAPPGSPGGTAGDVYVTESRAGAIDVFSDAGAYLGRITEAAGAAFPGEVCGVAVDPSGDLFVATFDGSVDKYVPSADPPTGAAYDSQITGLGSVCTIAAGASSLYVSTWSGGPEKPITIYPLAAFPGKGGSATSPPGHAIEEFGRPIQSLTASVDFADDELYVYREEDVAEYTLAGGFATLLESIGTGTLGPFGAGVAVDDATGDTYVVAGATIDLYGEPPPLAPAVEGESVADVTSSAAVLKATINPELRSTRYSFQFGADRSYGGGELPLPPGGALQGADSVSVQLEGLAPGTTYHYRVVATNRYGTTDGPDRTFATFQVQAGGLPDGRVWEMVSPLNKNGGSIAGLGGGAFGTSAAQASPGGEKVTFLSAASFGAARGNSLATQYLAARATTGWTTQNITPPLKSGSYLLINPFDGFSSDLSRGLLRNGGGEGPLPIVNPPLPGTTAPPGFSNFYLRDNETGGYQALLTSTPSILPDTTFYMEAEGFTSDMSHLVVAVKSTAAFGNLELSEWSAGALTPINIGTNGESVSGAVLGSGTPPGSEATHAISADGSRVFWSVGGDADGGSGSEPVYVREDPGGSDPRTIQLPPGEFVDAATTGSRVLLSTGEVFDLDTMSKLADITAGIGGFVGELGASDDLSRVYFLDTAVLPGAGANGSGQTPLSGANNIYLYREGRATRFIGTLAADSEPGTPSSSPDYSAFSRGLSNRLARVTGDGEAAVFESQAPLTGYDNLDAATGQPDGEVFVYHADTARLECASCNPTGERPIGSATIPPGNKTEESNGEKRAYYQARVLSSDGSRVFFDSPEALVEADTNNAQDVYEYQDARAQLISSGTAGPSSFFDASENGDDVFFTTANQLVPSDSDQLIDLYDARVAGGFPAPATAPLCTGSGCQGAPAPAPIFATPSSITAVGVGNFTAPLVAKPTGRTNARKLAAALRACKKLAKRKRAACARQVHRKYPPAGKQVKRAKR